MFFEAYGLFSKMDIPFTVGEYNIKWPTVMADIRATIRENPDEFFEDGGWDFLQEDKEGSVHGEEAGEEDLPEGDSEDCCLCLEEPYCFRF